MEDTLGSKEICENCGHPIIREYRKDKQLARTPQRFCCRSCARSFSTKAKRLEINTKVSKKLREKAFADSKNPYWKKGVSAMAQKNHANKMARRVKVKTTDGVRAEVDITYGELEEYKKGHGRCEICGMEEGVLYKKSQTRCHLATDHDHNTGRFRGLLCYKCNISLGWYEKQRENIKKYLGE